MNVAILRFPGTNCEFDTQYAFEKLGHSTQIIWHNDETLPDDIDLVVVPGGFSYGDYLRSGSIARFAPVMQEVSKYAANGGKVLGICNGFQILTEAGLLPGALKRNTNLHFISKYQHLKVVSTDNTFLNKCKKDEIIHIPIAHADGNYYVDDENLAKMKANGQVLLRYCDIDGNEESINGSVESIAGVCNETKNVFGLMPHPERAIEMLLGSDDGVKMLKGFEN
jgi:phosphoribosylformylglycinamidine synthase subunit PurQ / glutaminase